MLKIAHLTMKPVTRKDPHKQSSVETRGDLKRTSDSPVTSTEDKLLALESYIQGLEGDGEIPVNVLDQRNVGDNESADNKNLQTQVFNEQNTGNKPDFSGLAIEREGIPVSLESKDVVTGVQKLTRDEIAKTVSLVEELLHNTPLLIEKRDQAGFVAVVDSPLVEPGALFKDETKSDMYGVNATEQKQQVVETEPSFIVPELIAKVISTATASWKSSGLKLNESTVLLLTNGMAYTSLTGPPGEIALPAGINEADSKWTTWRQDDSGAIFLARPGIDGESLLTGEEIDVTPLKNEDISGLHTKTTASNYGATMITSWADIKFNIDGTFEKARSVLTTTGGAGTMLTDMFTSSFHQRTADGNSSVVGGTADMGNSGDQQSVNARSDVQSLNKNLYGTYHLLEDGLTIEMRYASGDVDRELLYRGESFLFFGESSYHTQSGNGHYFDELRNFARGLEKSKRITWLSHLADAVMAAGRKSSSQISHAAFGTDGKNGTAKGRGFL